MEGKSNFNFMILLIIVAVLTLTLAILVGYLFFVSGSAQAGADVAASDTSVVDIPADSMLSKRPIFEQKQLINLKTDGREISVIQINGVIRYLKKVKGIDNVETKLEFYNEEMREVVISYFQSLTIDQVRNPEFKKQAKIDIRDQLNDLLNSNENRKNLIIYEVIFDEWFYQ